MTKVQKEKYPDIMCIQTDHKFMHCALSMARRGAGLTAPNPSVGCVIVNKDGCIIARAVTSSGGRPHAEKIALEKAGVAAKGATAYVTLEPCAHHGQTPPCAMALAEAGVARVVIGVLDCDPRVSGKGVEILKNAGIEVVTGVLEAKCRAAHQEFFTRITKQRPFITLKTAMTLDGKTATASGQSKWITGEQARAHVHLMRAQHDAVLVGVETVLADDPLLTVRGRVQNKPMIRIVLDSALRIPVDAKIVDNSVDEPVWIFFDPNSSEIEKREALGEVKGVISVPINPHDLNAVMNYVANQGVNSVFVEGGSTVHGSFLRTKLYDRLMIYTAPKLLGGAARSAFPDLGVHDLSQAHDLVLQKKMMLGQDCLEIYGLKG